MSHDDRNLMRTFTAVDRRADLLVGVSLATGFPAGLTVLLLVVSDIGQPLSLRLSLMAVLLGTLSIGSALTGHRARPSNGGLAAFPGRPGTPDRR